MSYGLIYTAEFDSLNGEGYSIEIYKKDYSGSDSELLLGGTPVLHRWDDDNPHAYIKGSSCEIEIVSDGVSLSDFYSNEDDTFKIIVSRETLLTRFVGFLVQEESTEIQVDYRHIIKLTFTDGLGILKDIDLLTASKNLGEVTTVTRDIVSLTSIINVSGVPFGVQAGMTLIISGTGAIDGSYTVSDVIYFGSIYTIKISGIFAVSSSFTGATLSYITPVDITGRLKYSEIIPLCLKSTGLYLGTFVYSKLIPNDYVIGRWLESTMVDCKTFLNGDKWDSCYEVLEKIFKTFNATLFQSEGYWQIIRWDELRYQNNGITWYAYDSDFVYSILTGTLSREFTYGNGSDIATGLLSSLVRPYRFDKRTFKYIQNDNLIFNGNWEITGNLITSYTSGTDTIYEYEMAGWDDYGTSPAPVRRIRVIVDIDGKETRYGYIEGTFFDDTRAAQSQPIEMYAGDLFQYDFSFRTNVSQLNVSFGFGVRLFDGTTSKYLDSNGRWVATPQFPYSVYGSDDTNTWHSVTMKCEEPLPFTGVIYVYLANWAIAGPMETQYKDLRLTYTPAVSAQKNIIGHVHTNDQSLTINNSEDITILIDDAPRSSIKGTQFVDSFTGIVQNRTNLWGYDAGADGDRRLGEITTFETLFWKRIPRAKLDGEFLGLLQSPNLLSMLSVVAYQNMPDKWFIWGQLEIDYKRDSAKGTLYEQWEDGEVDGDLTQLYTFKYLYETK